jgi:hypothetical protein
MKVTSNHVSDINYSSKMCICVAPNCNFSATNITQPLNSMKDANQHLGWRDWEERISPNLKGRAMRMELHIASCTS